MFWLQAPAHTGKTTFVQGLAEAEIAEQPISERFAGEAGGKIVAYYCRKEHRTGLAGLINSLDRKLYEVYDVSDNSRSEVPASKPVVDAATPEAFVDWLSQWREFATKFRLAAPEAPLLIAIDGLDEAEPPTASSALNALPHPDALPEGIYLLLTSRPVDEPESPKFLKSHVEPRYGEPTHGEAAE